MRRTRGLTTALLAAVCLTLAACGGSGGGGTGDTVSFTVVRGGPPGADMALTPQATARVAEKYGYDAEFTSVAESELGIEGVATGEFEIAAATTSAAMKAIQQGAEITFIAEEARNPWTIQATGDVSSCQDLAGKTLGLHSPGGVSTALFESWRADNCEGVEFETLYIEGSPNRVQAMLAGQLDASMIERADVNELPRDAYTTLANFSQDLRHIKTNLIVANNEFLETNREAAVRWLAEMLAMQRAVQDDPEALTGILTEELDALDAEQIQGVVEVQLDAEAYPPDGGMTNDEVQQSIDFYTDAGTLDPGLTAEDVMDRSYLEDAAALLDEGGGEDGAQPEPTEQP